MTVKLRVLLFTAVVLASATTRATAQDANHGVRSGFALSLGLGQGSAGVTCEDCGVDIEDRLSGLSGYLRLGGYATPRLLVGVEGTGWLHNSDGLERRIAAVSLVLVGFPSATAGFHVRSGFSGIRASLALR